MTNNKNRQLSRTIGTAMVMLALLTMLAVPTSARGLTSEDKNDLLTVTKQIILRTAEVGFHEAGSRLLGPTAWRYLKEAATPVFSYLKQEYPNLFSGTDKGSPKLKQQARDAARTFQESREMQSMLIEGFNNLGTGQQEILTEIRLLKESLKKTNYAIDKMSKLNQKNFAKILYELELLRNERKLPKESPIVAASEWPIMFQEKFDDNLNGWNSGNYPLEHTPKFDIQIDNGRYHWDVAYIGNWQRFVIAPIGTVVNFSLGVEVMVIDYTPEIAFSLLFCATENDRYAFTVSTNGMYNVGRIRGANMAKELVVDWTRFSTNFKPKKWNKLLLVVNDQMMYFYINSKLVGEYRDINLSGGRVGIGLDIFQTGNAVVDFDNFQLRRRP